MSTAITSKTPATLADLIERGEPGKGPLDDLRARAIRRAGELGLPEKSDEEWRYTNPAPIRDLLCGLAEARPFEG